MVIDHFGLIFFPSEGIYRIIGRVAFILFAFLLAEGTKHTNDFKAYLKRLFIWALISEIPFDLAMTGKFFDWQNQNVFWTLFLSAFGIYHLKNAHYLWNSQKLAVIIATLFVGDFINCDYGVYGLAVIYAFYLIKKIEKQVIAIQVLSSVATFFINILQMWSGLAFLPIALYKESEVLKQVKFFIRFTQFICLFFML